MGSRGEQTNPRAAPCCCAGSLSAWCSPLPIGPAQLHGVGTPPPVARTGVGRRPFAGFLGRLLHLDGGRQHPTASPYDRIRVPLLCSVQPAWHLCPPCCGRGVASCPPASSGVSLLAPAAHAGQPVALGLHPPGPAPGPVGLGGIALGPLTGVRPGRLGWGAPARAAPLLVCLSPFVCFPVCLQPPLLAAFLLHHALGV